MESVGSSAREGRRVCLTGGNGFIGSHLVLLLLEKGYNVSVTVQDDPSDVANVAHILPSPQADDGGRVRVFRADVLDRGPLETAIHGCEGIFHLASPCTLEDLKDPLSELVHPAVQGTKNVMEASKAANVKRVVLTSSISAMVPNPKLPVGKVVDENCWTDVDFCKERKKFYSVSKTMAEKAAWDYSKEYGIDVVAIHPSTCLGRLLQPRLNASSAVLLQLLQGSTDTQDHYWLGCVHVQEVSRAQILLYETSTASGRYLCTNGIYQFRDFAKMAAKMFPEFPVYSFPEETQPGLAECKDAAKRLIDLGLVFTSTEDTVIEAASSLREGLFWHSLTTSGFSILPVENYLFVVACNLVSF